MRASSETDSPTRPVPTAAADPPAVPGGKAGATSLGVDVLDNDPSGPRSMPVRRYLQKSRTALSVIAGSNPAGSRQGKRVARWEQRAQWPLAAMAVVWLAAWSVQVLHPHPPSWEAAAVNAFIIGTWIGFGVDYIARVCLARRPLVYASSNWLDLLIVALPTLRPLRVLRVVMLVRAINRKAAASMRGRVVAYGVVTAAILLYASSLAVLQAERHFHAHTHIDTNINSFGDAIWWSIVTVTTVGYGDTFPKSGEGRLVGVGLMIAGVGLFGAVTASVATWLVDQMRDEDAEEAATTQRELETMRTQLDRIEGQLAALQQAVTGATGPAARPPGGPAGRPRPK